MLIYYQRSLFVNFKKAQSLYFWRAFVSKPHHNSKLSLDIDQIIDNVEVFADSQLFKSVNSFKFSSPRYLTMGLDKTTQVSKDAKISGPKLDQAVLGPNKIENINARDLPEESGIPNLKELQSKKYYSVINNEIIYESPFKKSFLPEMNVAEYLLGELDVAVPHPFGDLPAIVFKDQHFTYNNIKINALKIAFNLKFNLQLTYSDTIMIVGSNSPDYVATVLACGACSVPIALINPDTTKNTEDLQYYLDKTKSKAIFINDAEVLPLLNLLSECKQPPSIDHIILLDMKSKIEESVMSLTTSHYTKSIFMHSINDFLMTEERHIPPIIMSADLHFDPKKTTMIIPFSSGTTGLPKGVLLSHYNITSNVQQLLNSGRRHTEADTLIHILPLFHSYGQIIFNYAVFKWGAKSIMMEKYKPEVFCELVAKHRVNTLYTVPPIIIMLAKWGKCGNYDLTSLRTIFSAAAPLDLDIIQILIARFPFIKNVFQGYGLSELSPISHADYYGADLSTNSLALFHDTVGKNCMNESKSLGSVGYLLPDCKMRILKTNYEHSQEKMEVAADFNEVGEVCISGPNVMVGYLDNKVATDNTFTHDGYLKTGDIGYVYYNSKEMIDLANNKLFIVDRIKELIKVKGLQVAPAELEGKLLKNPCVLDCCVVPIADEKAGERPKAYVVIKPQANQITPEELIRWFNTTQGIAEYKQLAALEFIDQIPKSSTGKILRRILRDRN